MSRLNSTILAAWLALLGAACASQPMAQDDTQLMNEAVARCKGYHPPQPTLNSIGDGVNLQRQMVQTEYFRLVDELRTPHGFDTLAARARTSTDLLEQYCTMEIMVRIDPQRARALYAELKDDPHYGLMVLRDEYLREALAPLQPPKREDPAKTGDK